MADTPWDWSTIGKLIGDVGNQDSLTGAVANYALTQSEGGLHPNGFNSPLLGNATRAGVLGPPE